MTKQDLKKNILILNKNIEKLGQSDGFKELDGQLVIPLKVYKTKTTTVTELIAEPLKEEAEEKFEEKRKKRLEEEAKNQ